MAEWKNAEEYQILSKQAVHSKHSQACRATSLQSEKGELCPIKKEHQSGGHSAPPPLWGVTTYLLAAPPLCVPENEAP